MFCFLNQSFNLIYSSLKEPNILKNLVKNKFITKIIASFHDFDNLYLVTNFYEGDMLYNYRNKKMSEEEIKFITACIIQALSYLREKKLLIEILE